MGLIFGGASASDLILDGRSVSLYVGGNPPVKVWPTRETVQITLGTGFAARDQFRAALTSRGLDYATVTELPFDIELVGSGEAIHLFYGCSALTSVPPLDTSQVTNMNGFFQMCGSLVTVPPLDTRNVVRAPAMFAYCRSLTHVPDMQASKIIDASNMFTGCTALTDGNVRLIGRHPNVSTTSMIDGSGLTRQPWYNADGTPIEVHEVSLTNVTGSGTVHPLLTVTVPAGETWIVRIQGTVTVASGNTNWQPFFRIGTAKSGKYGQGAAVDFSGTVTASNSTIAMVTGASYSSGTTSFTGTVTIEPWYNADGTPIAPREVTILSAAGGFAKSAAGDIDLVSGWPYASAYGQAVTFAAPVTCDRSVRTINEQGFSVNSAAGTTISAGKMTIPGDYSSGVTYVFTEVL